MNSGEMQDEISTILSEEGEKLALGERVNPHLAVAEHFYAKGLAEAESKVKAKEREIVEWLISWDELSLAKRLESWLRKE